jgi:putative ABC transport system ATP-binding protein
MPNLTLKENILIAGYLTDSSRKEIQRRAEMLMAKLDIEDLGDRFPSEVSGGQKQRFAIARAMINRPGIIMADEPTGNLNSSASNNVLECFVAAREEGQSIVMVTHDPNTAGYGDIIMFMKDGKILDSIEYQANISVKEKRNSLINWLSKHEW